MLYDPSTANHLKPWLIRTLEPICDAEPGALADYILALLKHNVSENEMRKELAVQLDEFLEKECPAFLETLFTVLRTKSYLPYAASPPPSFNSKPLDPGIPIPLDGLITPSSPDRGVKRGLEGDEREGRAPAKGPRLNSDGHFSRYPSHGRSSGGWNQRNGPNDYQGGGDSMNVFGGMGVIPVGVPNQQRGGSYQPPDQKRGICRDYHNHGYCARGAHCKYSHGDDAVIPPMYIGGSPLAPGLPFYPMFPGLVPFAGAAYDPHEARMDMRPLGGRNHARAPVIPRSQQEGQGMQMSGELPVIQDLTPVVPPEAGLDSDVPSTSVEHDQGFEPEDHSVAEAPVNSPNGSNGVDMDVSQQAPFTAVGLHNFRGGGRGGRGRGTFGGEAHRFRPEKRNDKTLVVEKIPEDKLSMERVREWFERFGTVTQVAIDPHSPKALVSFSTHEEAHAAWKSEDAVFNNRFVKIFWHRPLEGHGLAGARALAASAPLVANMAAQSTPAHAPPPATTTTQLAATRKTNANTTASDLAAKQALLEQQIAEQKSLMASLDTASAEEKKEILSRLRKLNEEMKKPVSSTQNTSLNGASQANTGKEKERLDKELELHSAKGAVTEGGEEESTEALKAKLEQLKAEAASLGITDSPSPGPYYGGGYRPYRGRGRGARGGYRGAPRGGPPRGSMKLDNRPKKLLVQGISEGSAQTVREWYEASGQVDSIEEQEGGDLVVSFRTRVAAEQALAKGHNIPAVGPVQVTWFSNKPTASGQSRTNNDETPPGEGNEGPGETSQSPHLHDEEVITGSWGGDDEDAMGMF